MLIHSLALDRQVWDAVVPLLAGADVVALDCRGHGRSGKPAGPYTVEAMGNDIADLLDALGWADAVVAGCSMGGCIAQAIAARHPERVTALALIDTTAWYGVDAPATWRERADKARAEGLAGMAAFQTTRWFGDAFRVKHPDRVAAAMTTFCANDIDAYAATCAMLGSADLRDVLPRIAVPVGIVVGEEDYATPIATAEAMRDTVPDATLRIIPAARHLTPIEAPAIIAEEIIRVAAREGSTVT